MGQICWDFREVEVLRMLSRLFMVSDLFPNNLRQLLQWKLDIKMLWTLSSY